jgi:hypothetical protein
MQRNLVLGTLAVVATLLAAAAPVNAQATRTWVSGTGDDANPCSRTAPCKTFAGAISKTASSGEINVLDPGGFGAVTITKPLTISSEGFEAGVLVSGTNAIIVNVPNAADVVVLRGLDIEGLGTGISGISVITGGTVLVEKCTIDHFTTGINFVPTVAGSQLHVLDTTVRNNKGAGTSAGGIFIAPTGAATASLEGVRLESNTFGIKTQGSTSTSVSRSLVAGNAFAGISAASGTAAIQVERSVVAQNGTGFSCAAGTTIRIGNTSVTNNATTVAGTCSTYKNNDIDVAVGLTPINPQ